MSEKEVIAVYNIQNNINKIFTLEEELNRYTKNEEEIIMELTLLENFKSNWANIILKESIKLTPFYRVILNILGITLLINPIYILNLSQHLLEPILSIMFLSSLGVITLSLNYGLEDRIIKHNYLNNRKYLELQSKLQDKNIELKQIKEDKYLCENILNSYKNKLYNYLETLPKEELEKISLSLGKESEEVAKLKKQKYLLETIKELQNCDQKPSIFEKNKNTQNQLIKKIKTKHFH